MAKKIHYNITVAAQACYLEEQSNPDHDRYVFAYTIRLENRGDAPAQLLARHWIITDANGKVEEVHAEGVVGEQPRLEPGEDFIYTSGAVIATAVGTMEGSYGLAGDDGTRFEAPIPPFTLSVPRTLH